MSEVIWLCVCVCVCVCATSVSVFLTVRLCLFSPVAIVRGEQTDTASQESSDSAAKSVGLKNFLEDITRGLLRARRILATSYAIGYLIPDERKAEREAHETLQARESLLTL